jgi:TPR repeat protein
LVYENGKGVVQDIKAAVAWYAKASAQGHADAAALHDACLARAAVASAALRA